MLFRSQLSESLTLNEKLNKENRAGNIQALKNDLKLADRALRSEKEKLRSANVTIGECQDKIRCLTQQRDYARTHQKIVEIPVEKPVLYEKCEACDRTDFYTVESTPTFILFRKGQQLWRQSGELPLERLERAVKVFKS